METVEEEKGGRRKTREGRKKETEKEGWKTKICGKREITEERKLLEYVREYKKRTASASCLRKTEIPCFPDKGCHSHCCGTYTVFLPTWAHSMVQGKKTLWKV
jgi:hypothetical protein